MPTIISEWIYCPVCGNKTRTMIREDTELKNFLSTVRNVSGKQLQCLMDATLLII